MIRVERIVTSGVFSLDGQDFDVDNNVWMVGESEVVVIDAAHDPDTIVAAVNDRPVVAVVCTHGHNDHINAAVEVAERVDAPVLIHPADRMLWDVVYPDIPPAGELADGLEISVGETALRVLHTPGHSPGSCSLELVGEGIVFSGDTLFEGGPGATGRSYSSYPTILQSIEQRLLTLPPETMVNTGHGPSTTIGAEAPALPEWKAKLD